MEKEDPIAVWPPVTTRTGPVFGYGAAAGSVTVIAEAVQAGLRTSINWPYGANPRTITAQLQRRGLRAVQVELSSDCFNPEHPAMTRAWSAMARAAQRLVGADLDRWSDLTRS